MGEDIGRFQFEDQFKLHRLLHRQIGRRSTLQKFVEPHGQARGTFRYARGAES